ncbi:MFS transporter [Paenibacillus timonensis]|uniref:MFS transporter n=1 Tax=Paenibacillus rhizolycopersici TaxID=2780073 RepID=UPI0012D8D79A|nr:MFS transporter [Paenibacillus timonensis]MUG87556.1 MFS transporter [Paenibacillus timonensis]
MMGFGNKTASREKSGLLQNRAYLALMSAQLVSNIGDWLYLLALLTMVGLKWQATPWEITMVSLFMVLPVLVGGPLAGMLADRIERKKLMVFSDLVRFVVLLGFVFVTAIWQVYVLLIAKGILDVIFSPAKNGKIKEIVPHEQLDQAVSYSAIIEQGTKIIGPALGGMLTAAFSVTVCFVVDAGTFLVSALLLSKVPGKLREAAEQLKSMEGEAGEPVSAKNKQSFWTEMAAGAKIIGGIPLLAFGTLILCATLLVLQIADSQAVVLFREIPGVSDDLLGWCITFSGVGTLTAAWFTQRLRIAPLFKMGFGGAMLGLVFAAAGFIVSHLSHTDGVTALMLTLFAFAGLGAGMTFIPFQVMLQQRTPEAVTGRVFGTVSSLTSTATLIGPLFGGSLVTAFGPEPAFILSGCLMAAIGFLLLTIAPAIMKRDRVAVEPAVGA